MSNWFFYFYVIFMLLMSINDYIYYSVMKTMILAMNEYRKDKYMTIFHRFNTLEIYDRLSTGAPILLALGSMNMLLKIVYSLAMYSPTILIFHPDAESVLDWSGFALFTLGPFIVYFFSAFLINNLLKKPLCLSIIKEIQNLVLQDKIYSDAVSELDTTGLYTNLQKKYFP